MSLFEKKEPDRYTVNYKYISTNKEFKDNVSEIKDMHYWVVDTETTGLDFLQDKVILLQLGDAKKQFVIDTRYVDISDLRYELEDESRYKILQYAAFDYKMIKSNFNITMENMYDPMLAEQILTCGLQRFGFGMKDLALKYLSIQIDKELQTSFIGHQGEFTRSQLRYAALDCVYPDLIMKKQITKLRKEGLAETFSIECKAIPAFADMTYYGMLLDKDAWMVNVEREKILSAKSKEDFTKMAAPHATSDLFGYSEVNPASPSQVLDLFINIFGEDALRDDDDKLGTGEAILQKLMETTNDPIVQTLLEYREHEKKVGTYGLKYVNAIHPVSGRFHPNIEQIGTATGRPSGKKPNMLNIPREPQYRHAWIAGPGRKILTNDYGACELRIMASMSEDPVMCKGFNDGVDYHTFTAAQFIKDNEPYLREIKKGKEAGKAKLGDFILDEAGNKIPNPNYRKKVLYENVLGSQRTIAKTINFGLTMPLGRSKTYSIQGNPTGTILSESNGNIGSVQRLTAETDRLWLGTER